MSKPKPISIASALRKGNHILAGSFSMKSIDYNRIMWKFYRDVYDAYGWTCLSRHYAEFVWSIEKNTHWLHLTKKEMNELKAYATDLDVIPWRYRELKPIDEEMFLVNCDRLSYQLHRVLKNTKRTVDNKLNIGCEETYI